MLAKLLIEVLCLGKDSADANRLLNFKAPKAAKMVGKSNLIYVGGVKLQVVLCPRLKIGCLFLCPRLNDQGILFLSCPVLSIGCRCQHKPSLNFQAMRDRDFIFGMYT